MKTPRNLLIVLVIIAAVLLVLIPIFSASGQASTTNRFNYGVRSLVGASPAEVGGFAIEFAQHQLTVLGPAPQVVMSRPAKTSELATLGLACIFPGGEYDHQPLMLVVLKGSFDFDKMPSGATVGHRIEPPVSYITYLFDLQSAQPIYLSGSLTGGRLRRVLGDTTLAEDFVGQLSESDAIATTPCTKSGVQDMPKANTVFATPTLRGIIPQPQVTP